MAAAEIIKECISIDAEGNKWLDWENAKKKLEEYGFKFIAPEELSIPNELGK